MNGTDGDDQRIKTAATAWARSIFSAPRHLGELVTGIEHRDEVIERVATHIVRRELREIRTATSERRSTRPRLDPRAMDPFAYTIDTLKVDSEYVTQCGVCAASGLMRCAGCNGTGHGQCPSCHGAGQERSAKTGRPIRCKSCNATGSAPCRGCAGHGSVACHACAGSGHQLAWLTFEETQRHAIAVPLNSPIVLTNRALREDRLIRSGELVTITVVDEKTSNGPLDLRELAEPDRQAVVAEMGRIDRRLERVLHQQYLKLTAARCDVTYEMCGTKATVSLSGTALAGATTPEAVRPIRRRLYIWGALCVLVGIIGLAVTNVVVGPSKFLEGTRATCEMLVFVAVGCAIPALGAILRSWRGGRRFHPMRWPTKAWSAGALVALALVAVIGLAAARPSAAEVQRALAINDVARARLVVDALEAQDGATPDLKDLEDRVTLAEASKLHGAPQLQKLDAVVARKGAAAGDAAAAARAQRLEQIRQLVAEHHATEALAALDKLFPSDNTAPVAEERARAHEVALAACTTAACQLGEALQAGAARSTPDRAAAITQAHTRVAAGLEPKLIDAKETLPRLQQLRQLRDAGAAAAKVAPDDADLQTRARDAIAFADAERAKVPLLTNDLAVVEELLGASTRSESGAPSIALDEGTVYLSIDQAGKCTGIYAVGEKAAERAFHSKAWPADRLLSQAIGKPSVLQLPTAAGTTSSWHASGASIVARWQAGALVELRIGDATP